MLTAPVHWVINQTWDGSPIAPHLHATVTLSPTPNGDLLLNIDAPYLADPPPPSPPHQSTDRLWEHEVVEVFILGPDDHYTEVELGPHGHWLLLRLHGVRAPYARPPLTAYTAHINPSSSRWRGRAVIAAAHLPPSPWRANAYALHGPPSARHFLAVHPVPGPHPDFHRLQHFAPLH